VLAQPAPQRFPRCRTDLTPLTPLELLAFGLVVDDVVFENHRDPVQAAQFLRCGLVEDRPTVGDLAWAGESADALSLECGKPRSRD
jgi:hypothetical protein